MPDREMDVTDTRLHNSVRRYRRDLGLSQEALGDRVGVSRHAIMAIEGGRQVPSTTLALRLADTFDCAVKDLFRLGPVPELEVHLPPPRPAATASPPVPSPRVSVGRVGDRWAAHPLPAHATGAADAIMVEATAARQADPNDGRPTAASIAAQPGETAAAGHARVRPVRGMQQLERNVLVAGCAPLLANLAHRVGEGSVDARATWIPASSHRALDLLAAGLVHIAGLHLSGGVASEANVRAVRRHFPGRRMLVVNLTRWRQGFVVAARNPLDIRDASDLLRPGVRVVGREPGTGADDLFARLLAGEGDGRPDFSGPVAEGHLDVARRVHCGAADTGVAIESAALAWGLGFVPLVEERFDLVIPADIAEASPVSRFLETLDDPGFRAEAASLPGYDTSISGHASTLEAGGAGS